MRLNLNRGAVALLAFGAAGLASAGEVTVHRFDREAVLGTSFHLSVLTDDAEVAAACERRALEAIERLRQVLSTWDADSELSRLNAVGWDARAGTVSEELAAVLRASLRWREQTGGVFHPYLGELHDAWRRAGESGQEPEASRLEALAAAASADAGFTLDDARRLACTRDGRFDLDGIAKGFIIDRALEAALDGAEGVKGALLEIGGDLRVWGSGVAGRPLAPWVVEVADPRDSADNAPPLATLALDERAVASSGGYARPLVIDGKRYPQLFDPRSGRPAMGVLGATVVAVDAATADALATALCVLPVAEGIACAERAGAECAIVDVDGGLHTSSGWAALAAATEPALWDSEARVEFAFRLVDSTGGRRFKRHYVAVWVEDMAGKRIKLLALWARRGEMKYLRDLPAFWREAWLGSGGEDNPKALRTRSRATRKPGAYTLSWDGTDEDGKLVPRGRYRIRIDINREHGPNRERHTEAALELDCGAAAVSAAAEDQPELADVRASYQPGTQPSEPAQKDYY